MCGDELAQHVLVCVQASGLDVDHAANETEQQLQEQQQQQPDVLLSICPAPEAHTKADQPERGEAPHGPPAEQLESVTMTNGAPVLGDESPRPDQEQGRALAEKRQNEAFGNDSQCTEALSTAAAASAAHVGRVEMAKSSDVATQHAGEQNRTSAPTLLTDKQLAGQQPEAAAYVEGVNSMSIACSRTPSTEAVSVQQQADAAASPPDQEELPSMQCAMCGPAQAACTGAQQLADGAAHNCAAGHSQHELTCDQVVQGLSNSILAGDAVYPLMGEGSDPQQLAGDSPTAHDVPEAQEAFVADDASLADHAPVADDAPMPGDTSGGDVTPMADDAFSADGAPGTDGTPTATDTVMAHVMSVADDTPMADASPMADGIPKAGHTLLVGPAAGSSKAIPPSRQAHQGGIASWQADPQEQKAHVQSHQQHIDGHADLEQGADNNQLGDQTGVMPSSAPGESANAGQDAAERLLMSMSEAPDNSAVVPDSEEPDGDVSEAVASQLQRFGDYTLVNTANQDEVDVHVQDSSDQALPVPHQQHSAVQDRSPTSSIGGTDAADHAATLAPGAQGDLQHALF